MSTESYVLTPPELHLGHIKETFRRGAVIQFDPERNTLTIDGRRFEDTRDIDVLKRQAHKHPDKPWILPATEETISAMKGYGPAPTPKKPRPIEHMAVVQSDQDLVDPIDIRHTQVSKRNAEAKDAARTAAHDRDRNRAMEVIRGDETVEERIANHNAVESRILELEDYMASRKANGKPTDLSAQAELVKLKSRQPMKRAIVKDDSLGAGVGRSELAMNAGQHLPSREDVESRAEEQALIAAGRKRQAEAARKKMLSDQGLPADDYEVVPSAVPAPAREPSTAPEPTGNADVPIAGGIEEGGPSEVPRSAEAARIAALEDRMGGIESTQGQMMGLLQQIAGQGAEKAPEAVTRVPVTDPAQAEALLAEKEGVAG
jgi:hypothetical protein